MNPQFVPYCRISLLPELCLHVSRECHITSGERIRYVFTILSTWQNGYLLHVPKIFVSLRCLLFLLATLGKHEGLDFTDTVTVQGLTFICRS